MRGLLAAFAVLVSACATAPDPTPADGAARFDWFEYSGEDPPVARAGPGEYLNPILSGFYPDPSVTRVGADYYLVNSTFA